MFGLSKAPLGLLQLFRLRTDGRLPDLFSNSVQPVVETAEFYGAQSMLVSGSTPTVGALDLLEFFLLSGPIRIRSMQGALAVGAAAATNVCVDIGFVDPSGAASAVASIVAANVGAGKLLTCACVFPRPPIVPAGWQLYSRASGTAAGADHTMSVNAVIDVITGND